MGGRGGLTHAGSQAGGMGVCEPHPGLLWEVLLGGLTPPRGATGRGVQQLVCCWLSEVRFMLVLGCIWLEALGCHPRCGRVRAKRFLRLGLSWCRDGNVCGVPRRHRRKLVRGVGVRPLNVNC